MSSYYNKSFVLDKNTGGKLGEIGIGGNYGQKYVILIGDEDGVVGLYSAPDTYEKLKADCLGWRRLVPSMDNLYIALYNPEVSNPKYYKIIEKI